MTDEQIIRTALQSGQFVDAFAAALALDRLTQRLADYEIATQARVDRIVQLEAELVELKEAFRAQRGQNSLKGS